MQFEAPGTLARLMTSPYRRRQRIVVTASDLAQVILKVTKKGDFASPDSEAVRFYALHQLVAILGVKFTPSEKLPSEFADILMAYEKELENQNSRMSWYTFLITTREFRHLGSSSSHFAGHTDVYSGEFVEFFPHIADSSSDATINEWVKKLPPDDLEHYCRCLVHGFTKGAWGHGFGGKPWGMIARTLAEYIGGNTSAEMFIDTAYTLAHNNGPMFNKGMLYGMYNSTYFKKILDVQRGGQICEGLLSGEVQKMCPTLVGGDVLTEWTKKVRNTFGGIGDHIDWADVQKKGALGDHMPKTTSSTLAKDAEAMAKVAKKGPAAEAVFDGQKAKYVTDFVVMKKQKVAIYAREKAAA